MAHARSLLLVALMVALLGTAAISGHAESTAVDATAGSGDVDRSVGVSPRPASNTVVERVTEGHASADPVTDRSAAADRAPQTDDTVTRIAVRPAGDARWTVRIRTRLETDEDVEQYRGFQERFRENTSRFRDPFAERMAAVAADASNVTDREMTVRNVTSSTSIQEVPRRWGVVSFTLTWTNFAAVDGDSLIVGDVFEDGFFLAGNDSLVVEAAPGYTVGSAHPEPADVDGKAVTWVGREDFADRRPRVEFVPVETDAPTLTASPTAQERSGASGRLLLGVVAVAVVLSGLGARFAGRLDLADAPFVGGPADGSPGTRTGTDDVGDDARVLTDAEKVEDLLADNGGRMKQSTVADELGWSASKTSRVVRDMVEEERVEKLRIGRENVLDLPE